MQNFRAFPLLLIALIFLSVSYWFPSVVTLSEEAELETFQKKFDIELENLKASNLDLAEKFNVVSNPFSIDKEEFQYCHFVFNGDSLIYWNNDNISFNQNEIFRSEDVYLAQNGWYAIQKSTQKGLTFISLAPIKYQYPLKNQFLTNEFSENFKSSQFSTIQIEENQFPIINKEGKALFYLKEGKQKTNLIVILFCLGCLTISFYFFLLRWPNIFKTGRYTIAFYIALVLRVFLFFYLPETFRSIKLFQPEWLAINAFIPSLGDLLLHIVTIFILLYQLHFILKKASRKFIISLYSALFIAQNFFALYLIQWSIASSTITYNFNNLFELNYLSILGFISFILLICISYQIAHTLIHYTSPKNRLKTLLAISLILLVGTTIFYGFNFYYLWSIPLLFFIYHPFKKIASQHAFSVILMLLYSSSVFSLWINKQIEQQATNEQYSTLYKLAEEKDPIAEFLFHQLQPKLENDSFVINALPNYWENKSEVDEYIKSLYFNGFWENYQVNVTVCQPTDELYIDNQTTSCFDYFNQRIRSEESMVSSSNLFRFSNLAGRIDYIGELKAIKDSINYRIYLELSSIILNESEGYPELLLDEKSQQVSFNLSQTSYAVYKSNELMYKSGNYNYSTQLKINELTNNSSYQYVTENHQHIIYQKNDNVAIIISSLIGDEYTFLTTLAYLSVILGIIFFIFTFSLKKFPFHFKLNLQDFSTKIQLFLIVSIISSLFLLALGTTYYIQKQYKIKNEKALEEKIRSVNFELYTKIGQEEYLAPEIEDYLFSYLVKFSNVFYTDINIYDLNGLLFSSSRPEVFDTGLKSDRMNPTAVNAVINEKRAQWIQKESIGNQEYFSAYIPFKNNYNQTIGYLNLPYFAKQGELEEEISTFLVSTLNIYVAIFVLSLLISVLLINQLSKPLLLIRSQIAKLKLGSNIELIEWNSKDEIGALVAEYNRIALELSESAEQLAKSEREGAWREMAKQVAHEIKNPLTPMKLSIQHLQMAAKQNSEDLPERINRTAKTLVEQIDTLTNIATAFSSFGKLPSKNYSKLNVVPLLKNVVDLYSHNVAIEFNEQVNELYINGDQDQLLRVFNNIIKNAVQAVEETEKPTIIVNLLEQEQIIYISIQDNGVGISPLQAQRIFEPNFTTKTSGTGLGLAMSKNIIEQMDGKISFSSVENVGTTFTIELKKA